MRVTKYTKLIPQLKSSSSSRALSTDELIDVRAAAKPCLTQACREQFLKVCWGIDLSSGKGCMVQLEKYDNYFRHYETSCMQMPSDLNECTHEHFCKVLLALINGTRQNVQDHISSSVWLPKSVLADSVAGLIDFVTAAILMIHSGDWLASETFVNFIKRKMGDASNQLDQGRLPRSFNLRTFSVTAGIKVLWTRDLFSHLIVGENDETISIFHNMQVLDMLQHSAFKDLFPVGSLDELRKSIWLLLPVNDRRCYKWAHKQHKLKQQQQNPLGLKFDEYKHLAPFERNIQDFVHCRDRLIIAKEAFDNSQPKGLRQFWYDDRNMVQWWTFWVAIVVFLLTLIGVVEGAMQVYKAYHPS